MHSVIAKTFGGLSTGYYVRQLVFGAGLGTVVLWIGYPSFNDISVATLMFFAVSTLLYPYSRFVYESVADFIVGDNVIFLPTIIALPFKLMTMSLCFVGAILMAPLGLAYLYVHHSKEAKPS